MAEQITLAHLGQNVSITGTVRTEEGWEDDLTREGVVQSLQVGITDPPNALPQQAMATLYVDEETDPHRVRFDPATANVTPL